MLRLLDRNFICTHIRFRETKSDDETLKYDTLGINFSTSKILIFLFSFFCTYSVFSQSYKWNCVQNIICFMFRKVINKVSSTTSAGDSPAHHPSVTVDTIVCASAPGATIAESVSASAPGPSATIAESFGASTPGPSASIAETVSVTNTVLLLQAPVLLLLKLLVLPLPVLVLLLLKLLVLTLPAPVLLLLKLLD
jgi:hypothetical protein